MKPWRTLLTLATHHVFPDGSPAYAERFDKVASFHPPGLAPVLREGKAWHIRSDGSPAYARRFREVYGFYEGLAAALLDDGWTHIHPDGWELTPERYAWVGSFQHGRCPVRRRDGLYVHIDAEGAPVGEGRWRYAGDFRERAAVVQRADGLSSHVDSSGELLHGCWFLDLDGFTRGIARARDHRGWHHIGRDGAALYERRFVMVEAFYNGQARAESEDGAIELIDRQGRTVHVVREAQRSVAHTLTERLVGSWSTWTLRAAVELGALDALPATAEELDGRLALPAGRSLRLLRALWELGLVEPTDAGWSPTATGALLRRDHARSLADAAVEHGGALGDCMRGLGRALRSPVWRPDLACEVAGDAERRVTYHRMLASYAEEELPRAIPLLPVRSGDVVVDAGGGAGVLARRVAARFPDADVVRLDLPEIIARWPLDGVRSVAVDLFEAWPVQADVIVLARLLCELDDGDAGRLLRRAVAALRAGGRVCVVDHVIDPDRPDRSLWDLHLLATSGGQERDEGAWQALLEGAGLRVSGLRPTGGGLMVVVAVVG